jgi:hypothetical protein
LAIMRSDSGSCSSCSVCEVLTLATKHIASKPTRGQVMSANIGREGGASVASGLRSISLTFRGVCSSQRARGKWPQAILLRYANPALR